MRDIKNRNLLKVPLDLLIEQNFKETLLLKYKYKINYNYLEKLRKFKVI